MSVATFKVVYGQDHVSRDTQCIATWAAARCIKYKNMKVSHEVSGTQSYPEMCWHRVSG